MFQKAIDEQSGTGEKPKIQGVRTVGTSAVKLHFRSKEDAAKTRALDIDWSHAYEGLKAHKPQYGIVVHGIATATIESEEPNQLIKRWEEQNDIKITRITPLRRNSKPAAHKSMIIFTDDAAAANECILRNFFDNSEILKVAKYCPHLHINQCYRCHGFGHRSTECKHEERCGRCGKDDHKTNECNATQPHCVNCGGDHEAWHLQCGKRTEIGKLLHQRRSNTSALFEA
jgi:hypothetical protein